MVSIAGCTRGAFNEHPSLDRVGIVEADYILRANSTQPELPLTQFKALGCQTECLDFQKT